MTFFPDLGTVTLIAAGPHVRAVGWLDLEHEFSKGEPQAEFVTKLQRFVEQWEESARLLGFPQLLGGHTCEFCGNAHGTGDFGIPFGDLLFVAPTLILHYIGSHQYLPPSDFITAVRRSPTPGSWRYRRLIGRFQHVRMPPEDRQRVSNAIREWAFGQAMPAERSKEPLQPTNGEARNVKPKKT
jgi:hypothetical protein